MQRGVHRSSQLHHATPRHAALPLPAPRSHQASHGGGVDGRDLRELIIMVIHHDLQELRTKAAETQKALASLYLTDEVGAHIAGCAKISQFVSKTLMMEEARALPLHTVSFWACRPRQSMSRSSHPERDAHLMPWPAPHPQTLMSPLRTTHPQYLDGQEVDVDLVLSGGEATYGGVTGARGRVLAS